MYRCQVCGATEARSEIVSEVFLMDGVPVLVEGIPRVWVRAAWAHDRTDSAMGSQERPPVNDDATSPTFLCRARGRGVAATSGR